MLSSSGHFSVYCLTFLVCLLAAVPRLSTTCGVPPHMNKLAVTGQTFDGSESEGSQYPIPLEGEAKPVPLQVYETDRPFFGSTPVGGLELMTSELSCLICCC